MPTPSPGQSPESAAVEIEAALVALYARGRAASRATSLARLEAELGLLAPGIRVPGLSRELAYEIDRARLAAGGYAEHWLDDVIDAIDHDLARPFDVATRQQVWRLEMGGTTESAEAFNAERERALLQVARENPGVQLAKVWDAELDKRTCRTCTEAHGTVVLLHEAFPHGVPGHVHPRCRCIEQILPLSVALAAA
jgi:hypothetical protein